MKGKYLRINRNTVLLIVLLCTSLGSIAQQELMPEVPDDPQIFVDRASMQRGASWSQRGSDLMTTQVNVDENGDNILGDAGNEPSGLRILRSGAVDLRDSDNKLLDRLGEGESFPALGLHPWGDDLFRRRVVLCWGGRRG